MNTFLLWAVTALLFFLLIVVAIPVVAAEPDYEYVDLAYASGELDPSDSADADVDGYRVTISDNLLNTDVWLYGAYSKLEDNEPAQEFEIETIHFAVGPIRKVSDHATVDIAINWRQDKVDDKLANIDEKFNGVALTIGGRYRLVDMLEVQGRLGIFGGDYTSRPYLDLALIGYLTDLFSVSLAYETIELEGSSEDAELNQIRLGGRLHF